MGGFDDIGECSDGFWWDVVCRNGESTRGGLGGDGGG